MCDARTVNGQDLVAVDMVFPHYVGEMYQIYHKPDQKWYYLDKQTTDEVWIIKMCDSGASESNGVSQCEIIELDPIIV